MTEESHDTRGLVAEKWPDSVVRSLHDPGKTETTRCKVPVKMDIIAADRSHV